MGDYYVFHRTARGYSHKKKGIPCEDASASSMGAGEFGKYYIAAVADGHGDSTCIRSTNGSEIAVKAAVKCLKDFAEGILEAQADVETVMMEQLSDIRRQAEIVRQITDELLIQWNDGVLSHIQEHPFQEMELEQAGSAADYYRAGKNLSHAYGTTLLAALMLPGYLLLIQQGDGRCDVFYEDGEVAQPIPWDDRCCQNVTTSMCDPDAADRIRSCVIPLDKRKVSACFLGSDGVEDSYRNMEGTHMFYREVSCMLTEMDVFFENLDGILEGLSRNGSGDDVSIAAIVDIGALGQQADAFQKQIQRYSLEEERVYYEERQISMSRKHGILRERMEEAQNGMQAGQLYDQAKQEFEDYDAKFREVQENIRRIADEIENLDRDILDYEEGG